MKNSILTVMKKEFTRFFTDRRMILTTLVMPGLMIYIVYSFMGTGLQSQFETAEDYTAKISVENLPESIRAMQAPISYTEISPDETEQVLEDLKNGEEDCDLVAVFPEDFDAQVADYDVADHAAAPAVKLYYNSTQSNSQSTYTMMREILDVYESALANRFDVNPGEETYDMATEEDMSAQVFSMMVPMLLMIFLFSGCMAVAPESIAGEKERGTIATLLVTPVKRSHLAIGKIVSLSVIAILSGLSSFLGTMLSLPKLMGDGESVDASVYNIGDYVLTLLVILSTVLVIITLVSIISAFAKNVKEATGWVTPVMIISMLLGVTSMVESLCMTDPVWFLIPLYNSVQSMNGIFSMEPDLINIAVTVVANIVYAGVGVFVLAKMFDNEKVMFSK
ncbi:MAG: ABC transporter permease [Lachnospiraceae bacterium]|jgi:sodium transport system permease protein|nr:ABC transporter permease [Lachnospiraceae bacterium]